MWFCTCYVVFVVLSGVQMFLFQRQYVLELDREWGFYSKHKINVKLYQPQL